MEWKPVEWKPDNQLGTSWTVVGNDAAWVVRESDGTWSGTRCLMDEVRRFKDVRTAAIYVGKRCCRECGSDL